MRAWTKLLCVLLLASAGACSNEANQEPTGDGARQSAGDPGDFEASAKGEGSRGDGDGSDDSPAPVANSVGSMVAPPAASAPMTGMASGPSMPGGGSFGAAGAAATPVPGAPADSDSAGEPSSAPSTTGVQQTPQSGILTAGAWDDNRNFERFSQYRSDLLQNGLDGALPTEDSEHADAHEQFATGPSAHQKLDVALVIDTTGSMGDEIRYLQTELTAISQEIKAAYPDAEQRWALVAYKDQGDSYVVQSTDFDSNVTMFNQKLGALSAGGGGDMPEAPDAALNAMTMFAWRAEDDVAKLAFWVADAPHHARNAAAMAEGIRDAHDLGVHIYPVASSGIDELTELTMRSSAQLTGGRYLFLTNDSGVGGDHKEPTIPCYFVTRLDRAMARMIDIEMSGEYHEPADGDIIRTGGDPEDGACKLASGDQVAVF